MSLEHFATPSTFTGKNLSSLIVLATITAARDGLVQCEFNCAGLNGAAASFTAVLKRTTSGDVTIKEYYFTADPKRTATDTVYGSGFNAVYVASGEKLVLSLLSTNASDTAAAGTVCWIDATAANVVRLDGTATSGEVPASVATGKDVDAAWLRANGATASGQSTLLSAVNAITTNTARSGPVVPSWMVRPQTSSTIEDITIRLWTLKGELEDADAPVTIAARAQDGTSLNAKLSSTTMTRLSAGKYRVQYTVDSAHPAGVVYFDFAWAVGGVAMSDGAAAQVQDAESMATMLAIKAKTDLLGTASVASKADADAAMAAANAAKASADLANRAAPIDPRGPGAALVTIPFQDADGNPIADADVWITATPTGPAIAGTLQTDGAGCVTFLLDAGVTYFLWMQKDGVNSIRAQAFVAEADA